MEKKKEKERVIATKVSASIFGKAQLVDMQIHGDWKRGDLKELLEKALGLYSEVGEEYMKGEKVPKNIVEFLISGGMSTVEEKLKERIVKEAKKKRSTS